jgi:hypothetical protein
MNLRRRDFLRAALHFCSLLIDDTELASPPKERRNYVQRILWIAGYSIQFNS